MGIGKKNYDEQIDPHRIIFFKNPKEIISLCCGSLFCICICKNGVFSWGNNKNGELGIGNNKNQYSPQRIEFFQNSDEIISISCGDSFCVCVCNNGVFSWGDNKFGQLGIGHQIAQYYPQQIKFFNNSKKFIFLYCGSQFCVCVYEDGVFSWGNNNFGQLGIGNKDNQYFPRKIGFFENPKEIISLCCGSVYCVCICKNGVFSWGFNIYGQLGIGNQIEQSSPQQIEFFKNPEEIISLSCGSDFCICICKNGVYRWGSNDYHQIQSGFGLCFISPRPILFENEIESFLDLSFPRSSIDPFKKIKILLLILAREHLDPEEYLMGKDYLPGDMFKILLNFI